MAALIAQRLVQALIVLVVVSVLAFVLSTQIGDPVASILGLQATPADRLELRTRLGLDEPWPVQYFAFLRRVLTGELGVSYITQIPVAELIVTRLPATLELAGVALLLSLGLGLPIGIYAAVNRGHWSADAVLALSVVGVSIPTFVIAILLIFVFSVTLGWLPSFGRGQVVQVGWWSTGLLTDSGRRALLMPALALAISQVALVARLVRAEMLQVLRTDYIRFARARGIAPRVITLSLALRNTLIPVITVSGIQLGFLFAFAVVAEAVFQWPGIGLLFLQALGSTDVPVISAILLLTAAFFVAVNLVIDLLYALVDPRLRSGGMTGRADRA
ncbi:ABC transporter permease [Pararhodobacter sp. SW119]|uniref:ABC transporter permease n=1 Tax=Pararhodobacter sp. SW119 TaxID=2780075 RepID=UPI001ADFC2A4|nr:ABC transporter permease [Pararhodobacter sp. SW119]